jgi:hypothetical protein
MSAEHDRLTGWKEIAAYLNKGVRTVQRWEREYGLPVHRVGRDADVILAYRSEIERWVRQRAADSGGSARESVDTISTAPPVSATPDPAIPSEPPVAPLVPDPQREVPVTRWASARTVSAAAAALVIVVLAVITWARMPGGATPMGPVAWTTAGNVLEARDADGRRLWSHAFRAQTLDLTGDPAARRHPVIVRDLEGDGSRELLVALSDQMHRETSALFAFNADGSIRFRFAPTGDVVFGGRTHTGPWIPYRVFVLPGRDRAHDIWAVFVHGYLYPTLLVRLSVDGRVIDQYWSSGYIESVVRSHWRGQEVLFVAGTNNETRGGALAIFGIDAVGGSTPGANSAYRCGSCPSGGPSEMLFFPRRCVAAAKDYTATVSDVWRDERDRLHVLVTEGGREAHVAAWYVIGPDFQVESAEYTAAARYEHQRLETHRMLDHPFGADDVESLLPVQRWRVRGFSALRSAADVPRRGEAVRTGATVDRGRRPPA